MRLSLKELGLRALSQGEMRVVRGGSASTEAILCGNIGGKPTCCTGDFETCVSA